MRKGLKSILWVIALPWLILSLAGCKTRVFVEEQNGVKCTVTLSDGARMRASGHSYKVRENTLIEIRCNCGLKTSPFLVANYGGFRHPERVGYLPLNEAQNAHPFRLTDLTCPPGNGDSRGEASEFGTELLFLPGDSATSRSVFLKFFLPDPIEVCNRP
ncbi:MAG: hypothetical protein H6581_06380 [Bacteroidia bacterium]|nr:hypothetical protein [Bacteroidia bacterium]